MADASERRESRLHGPPPMVSRWRAVILFGLPGLILLAVALLISVSERTVLLSERGVLTLSTARVMTRTDRGQHAEIVHLPYSWDARNPGQRGSAVFTVTFDLPEVPRESLALQLPKVGNAYEVSLNGSIVERRGELHEFNGGDYSLLPRFVPVGLLLRQGTNQLAVAIRADLGRGAGLSQILVGPTRTIRDDLERRYYWHFVSATGVTAFSVAVGLLSLGFWRSQVKVFREGARRDDALYLYAALAELTGAFAAGASLVASPPIPWPWWGILLITTMAASISFSALSCTETAGWGESPHARRFRGWLAALVLACPAMAYAALGLGAAWALTLWYVVLGITVVGFAGLFLAGALRNATLEHQLASIAIAANLAAGAHDFYAFRMATDYVHVTMILYSSILFDLTLGFIVILRFRAANLQSLRLMRTLSDRVAERERELESSYRQLEQLARRQERMTERANILRDMHDGVGAHISMALRQIESGRLVREDLLPPLRDALDHLKLTIDNVHLPPGDVASLMGNLRYRLGSRIEASGVLLHWNVDPLAPVRRLDAQAMRQLTFILFEAISNALQHSRASDLRIEASETGNGIRLRVVDNGVGFDVASSPEKGLLSSRNRAERIGARFEIRSVPGETVVEVVIPRE